MQFPPVYFAQGNRTAKTLLAGACASIGVTLSTALIAASHIDNLASISMLYLLVVMTAALVLGRFGAILASLLSFFAFDWYFVQPHQRLDVRDPSEWLGLCTFLLTATVTSQLTVLLVNRVSAHEQSRRETEALAQASYAVTSELDLGKALDKILAQLSLAVPSATSRFVILQDDNQSPDVVATVKIVPKAIFQPVIADEKVLGVLQVETDTEALSEGQKRIIISLANLAGLTIQRDRLMKVEAMSEAVMKTERLKSALLSMVSHDFRSPLTAIKTSVASLLAEGQPITPARQKAMLTAVDHETDRLNHLIDNILDLSCLEAGVLDLNMEEIPVSEMVESALNTLSEVENKRIEVKLIGAPEQVTLDCLLMSQVLRNLLENALKYSPPEAPVQLECFSESKSAEEASGTNFIIEVKDRGRGLPKSEEALVFTPFFRATDVKETSIPGMGLGLALSKGLVEAQQGILSAYNREGGGAVFRITLPTHLKETIESQA